MRLNYAVYKCVCTVCMQACGCIQDERERERERISLPSLSSPAVKILDKRHIIKEKKVQYVSREKEVLAKINHPFFVKLFFTFQDKENLCILPLSYYHYSSLVYTDDHISVVFINWYLFWPQLTGVKWAIRKASIIAITLLDSSTFCVFYLCKPSPSPTQCKHF